MATVPECLAAGRGGRQRLARAGEGLRHRAQPVERLALELTAALRAHAERLADLLVALRGAIEAVAPDDHLSMARRKQPQHLPDLVPALALEHALRRVDCALVGHQVSQGRRVLSD